MMELEKLDRTATDDQLVVNCREEDRISFKPYLYNLGNYNQGRQDACDDPPAAIRNAALVGQAVVDSLDDFDFRPMLKKLSVRVLVVEGEKTNVPLDSTREWAKAPPQAQLLLIANAGHAVYVDQPAVLIRNLEAFLGR